MTLILITGATVKPVTLQHVKAHLQYDSDDKDAYIDSLIGQATAYLDGALGILGKCLVQQVWELRLEQWPTYPYRIEIPLPPLVSIDGVAYIDSAGDEQTIDESAYVWGINGEMPGWLQPAYAACWPTLSYCRPDAIRIRFTAGYAEADSGGLIGTIPGNIVQYMLLIIGDAFHNRQTVVTGTITSNINLADLLLKPHKLPAIS